MRAMQLCLSPNYGGLEGYVRDFARWLARRDDTEFFLALQSDTRLDDALRPLNRPTLHFPKSCGKFPLRAARRLASFVREHAVDAVHIHWKDDLPLAALAKKLGRHGAALVHTRHMNLPGKKHDPFHRFLYSSLDRLIVVTHYLERQAHAHLPMDPKRVVVVHNGCAPERDVSEAAVVRRADAIGLRRDQFNVGLFGRISEYKGQHLLIEAIDRLRRKGHDVHGWIIGEPFEPSYLEALQGDVARRSLTSHVHFVGFQEQPQELMPAFDVVTLTTKNETFGLVLIEAMRAGVAVIGSREGGVPEIVDHERTGLLFETWNAGALADAIERLYVDSSLRQRLAIAGKREAMESFDRDRQYGLVEAILREASGNMPTRKGVEPVAIRSVQPESAHTGVGS